MEHHKVTYTLPIELLNELNTFIEQRQRSRFVAEAVRLALKERKRLLEAEYKEAALDKDRMREIDEWAHLDLEAWDE